MKKQWLWWGLEGLGVVLALAALFIGVPILRARFAQGEQGRTTEARANEPQLVATNTVRLEADVAQSLGLKVEPVQAARHSRIFPPLLGSLTLDADKLARVQARFPGEVVELGKAGEPGAYDRPLAYGDKVKQGQLLAVLWSKELGEKKSELVDAWSQLQLDNETLERLEKLLTEGAVPEARVRQQHRAAEASKNALRRAERTLRVWQLSDEEIQQLYAEAKRLHESGSERSGKLDERWARVEVRAPIGGTILERNVNPREMINDTSRDLFKIACLDRLKVWAYASQDDLPILQELPRPIHWNVHLRTDSSTSVPGVVERIGDIVDTAQRAVLLIGSLENKQHLLRAGQLISATIEMDAPSGQLEVPTSALVEDGEESVVFVQPKANVHEYRLCPVRVLRRYQDVVLLQPRVAGALAAGDRVVVSGAVELKTVLENLQPAPRTARAN